MSLTTRIVELVDEVPLGAADPIDSAERELADRLQGEGRAAWGALTYRLSSSPADSDPESWERLAADPVFAAFARRALETAVARAAAIQAGELSYVAENAFARAEIDVLGRAARVALRNDEPWLPALMGRLLPAISVAPTSAKTLPSQALLFEMARAAELFPTPEVVAALHAVREVVRHAGVRKLLDRGFKRIDAALAGRPDTAFRLPDLGIGPDGVLRQDVGAYEARVAVTGQVMLTWYRPDGKALRGVPATVRREHPEALAELRDLVKRTRSHLVTLTRALEAELLTEHARPFGRWRAALAGHPLGRPLVERLIWEVEVGPGEWRPVLPTEGGHVVIDVSCRPRAVTDQTPVRLWHPVRSRPEQIRAWRDLLTGRQISQPFKQAFREIYLLTPAERETHTYSSRFATHVLDYRRLYPLFKARGWSTTMLGAWDGGYEADAMRELPGRWRVAFHHESVAGGELASAGQVWFERRVDGEQRRTALEEVPPVVFSEAMRDVDLFVAVTSIAADPEWIDQGESRHQALALRLAPAGERDS